MLFCTYSWWNPSHTLWGGWGRWYYLHLVRWDVQAQNVRGITLTGRVPPRHQNPSPQSPSHFPSCGAIPASQGEGTAVWCPGAHRADLSSNPTPVSWGSSFHSYNRRHGSTCSQRLLAMDRKNQWGKAHIAKDTARPPHLCLGSKYCVPHAIFFSCFRHWTAKKQKSQTLNPLPSFSLGYRTFLVLLFFYDQCLKIGRLHRKLKISQIS